MRSIIVAIILIVSGSAAWADECWLTRDLSEYQSCIAQEKRFKELERKMDDLENRQRWQRWEDEADRAWGEGERQKQEFIERNRR